MKNLSKVLSLVLALAMIVGVFTIGAAAFTDDEDISYEEAVEVLSAIKVLEGFEDGSFQPEGTVTREQAAKIVAYVKLGKTLADALVCEKDPFSDVKATRWSAGYIAYCVEVGILNGYGDGTFGPTQSVTGYQLVALLPLVPGGGIYYAMGYCLEGDTEQFLSALLGTLGMAAALAVGVILASSLFRAVFPRLARVPKRMPSGRQNP